MPAMFPDRHTLMHIGLINGQFPQTLYKYTSVGVLKLMLENRTIKFSRISEFNDKKECFAVLDFDCTPDEWRQYVAGINPELPEHIIHNMVESLKKNPDLGRQWITSAIKATNEALGILCLTSSNDNELMWAHYADSNKGVCLEFDLSKSINTFCFPKKVVYDSNVKRYNYIRSWIERKGMDVTEAIFHKSEHWAYENEYRVVRIDGAGLVPFNIESMRSICFGVDTSPEDIAEIRRICETNGYKHIKLLQNTINPNTGNYEIVALK